MSEIQVLLHLKPQENLIMSFKPTCTGAEVTVQARAASRGVCGCQEARGLLRDAADEFALHVDLIKRDQLQLYSAIPVHRHR